MRCFLLLFLFASCAAPQQLPGKQESTTKGAAKRPPNFIDSLLARYPEQFDSLLRNREKYRISVIYTRINRDAAGQPHFTDYSFNTDSFFYSYPASTVKLPVAVLALEKLQQLPGVNRESTMITMATVPGQTAVYNDPQSVDGRPTIANYIRKILLVSDNDAFNRLYEFLGQEAINNRLHQMGYDSVQIVHRLEVALSETQNRQTNAVNFYDAASRLIAAQPATRSEMTYQHRQEFIGKGFMRQGRLVEGPFDFSKKNRLPLKDLHAMLKALIFPAAVPPAQRFGLTDDDYAFLYRYMSMKPGESLSPSYPGYEEGYVKFLLAGGAGRLPDSVRIFNKVGDAYGFLTDAAYVVDFKNGVEFFLSATIYCNEDGILNDNRYDYESIGQPFMKNLGNAFYQYELSRTRAFPPNLQRFRINYTDAPE